MDSVKECFGLMTNNIGYMDKPMLVGLLEEFKLSFCEEEVNEMMAMLDIGEEGKIYQEEFLKMSKGKRIRDERMRV